MSPAPTSVVIRVDHAVGHDPACRRGRPPAPLASGGSFQFLSGTSSATVERVSVGAGPTSGSDVRRPGRPLLRVGAKELAIAGVVYLAYWFGRMLTRGSDIAASHNAGRVIDLERALGGFTEMKLQRWAIDVPGVVEFLNRYYVWVHFPATVAFLLWAFVARRDAYATIRTWFAAVTVAGLVIHVLFPLAPPRMTPGFVDTLDVYGPDIYTDDTSRSVANQFAAMPSLHFGWALIVAIGLGRLTRRRRRLWMAHPFVTLLAIVVTGNHYWIDAAVAGVLVVAAVGWWPLDPPADAAPLGVRRRSEPARRVARRRSAPAVGAGA
jgi:PAP2 superfamily